MIFLYLIPLVVAFVMLIIEATMARDNARPLPRMCEDPSKYDAKERAEATDQTTTVFAEGFDQIDWMCD